MILLLMDLRKLGSSSIMSIISCFFSSKNRNPIYKKKTLLCLSFGNQDVIGLCVGDIGKELKWSRSCFYPNEPLLFYRFFYTSLNPLPSDSSFPSRANHPNPRYNDCLESLVRLNSSLSVNAFSDSLSVFQILPAQVPTISGVMISTGDFVAVFFVVVFLVVVFLVVAIVICSDFVSC